MNILEHNYGNLLQGIKGYTRLCLLLTSLALSNILQAQEFINDDLLNPEANTSSKGGINNLGIQLFNTAGYDDLEASFWASIGKSARHNFNLRLSHNRFQGEYFGVGVGYGYELYAGKHLLLPYVTYNQNVETWDNTATVTGLYYSYGGRFDFALGSTTNTHRKSYTNNSVWLDAYYNIKAFGGMQIGAEYCVMTDTKDVYYGIILQKTLWTKKK